MAESKEYSTIVRCRKKLEIALKSDRDIALFLLQQGFITQERYDEIINPKSNLTDADKASMLVTAISNRVEISPDNYNKVVDHLRQNIRRYGDIIKILDAEYQGNTPPQPLPGSGSAKVASVEERTELDKDDYQEVFDKVKSLASKWELFAGKLHLSVDSISVIKKDHPNDAVGCLSAALTEWLELRYNYERFGKPSRKMLTESVQGLDNSLYEKLKKI